jgi:outer membrane lipoprotein-sorting protein
MKELYMAIRIGCILLSGCLGFGGAALAGTGDAAVTRFDNVANKPTDTWFSFEATTEAAGKAPRVMAFTVQNKGTKRLVNFEKPGDMKGTRVLVLSRQQMYVYLPAYNKVRRVASHVTEQGFMGTTYSDEDMSTTRFSEVYEAEILSENEGSVSVSLTPRTGASTAYGKLEMDLSKELGVPTQIRFFDSDLQHVKTEARGAYDCTGGACTPGEMAMTDHRRGDAVTTLKVLERKVNTGVSDATFSVRNLERGR